jgi:hypothetical protein
VGRVNATVVDRFARHAQLYGVEFVFEVAARDGFTPAELVRLARRLVHIDPKWHFAAARNGENWSTSESGSANPHSKAEKCHANGQVQRFGPDSPTRGKATVCAECGNPFVGARSTARYCSATCRQRAHRRGSA